MAILDLSRGLSVVIPFFNEGSNTVRATKAVKSALGMINHPFEIIVVDDGSTDEITGSSFSEEIRYIRKEHSGRIETRLRGLQEAKYPYVLFIDARVWINEESLINLNHLIQQYPDSRFWNGHVVLNPTSPLSSIWETLVGVGWRRISRFETVKFGIEEFDDFPKGTGFFLASKGDWINAFSKIANSKSSKVQISDDTKLLREFARTSDIWISGQVSALYNSRDSINSFVQNCFYRGQTFVDSYWESPTRFGRLVRWSFPISIVLLAISAIQDLWFGPLGMVIAFLLICMGLLFIYSFKEWRSVKRAFRETVVLPALILFFGFGFVRAYVLGFQSRRNA